MHFSVPVPCATHNPVWVFCVHAVRAGGKVCLLEASELIDFTSKTECEQNYLYVQSPTDPLALTNIVARGSS